MNEAHLNLLFCHPCSLAHMPLITLCLGCHAPPRLPSPSLAPALCHDPLLCPSLLAHPTPLPAAGKLVWAKVGSYPWWPAKLLDPHRDLSFPPDADPPRPTSIPIR